ncbi:MAG: methyltransferase small [Crocinitomicaceae bacterium]|nr:methyltransferase small [Crocinitomicaceae bacterium]
MKVGTDALVFGALAEFNSHGKALDIGTGTGVLSLMLAQRFPGLLIDAIEIDEEAFDEAQQNVENSPFSAVIKVFRGDFTQHGFEGSYDLIFSNPPYFEKAFLSGKKQKNLARHTNSLDFRILFEKTSRLLNPDGEFQLILPHEIREQITQTASQNGLFPRKVITVNGKEQQPVRSIFFFSKSAAETVQEDQLTIRNADGSYTEEYKALTIDFHFNAL